MNEEYKGIYFQNRNSSGRQKKFYEHGAHFNYMELYIILEEISKKIKPRINSSIPKKKNCSLNKKRASSCKRKKVLYLTKTNKKDNINNKKKIKTNNLNINKIKTYNNKKEFNNSLTFKKSTSKNLSCEKNIRKFNNYLLDLKKNSNKNQTPRDLGKKGNHIKYNSSIINNSMEYFYNNKVNLNESTNSNNYNNKNSNTNLYHAGKKNLKFNAIALSDFSKKNDNIIFTYNNKKKHDNEYKINKNKLLTDKNNNLITKENKTKSIIDNINPFNLKDERKKKDNLIIKNKMNISEITLNNLKSGTNYNNCKKRKNNFDCFDQSFQMKTPKCNYNEKTNKKNINKYNYIKPSQQIIKTNLNKTSIKELLKLPKCSKNKERTKIKLSRNNDNLKTDNSYFNKKENNFQLTFHNYKNDNLIKNYNLNNDNSEIIEVKSKKKKVGHSMERKDMKKYIKNKILEKNKLNLEIKEKINFNEIQESSKNNNNLDNNKNDDKNKYIINYCYKNNVYESNKSNNDSINKSKSNKNGDKKSIISTNLTSNINSRGIINPLHRKKIEISNV